MNFQELAFTVLPKILAEVPSEHRIDMAAATHVTLLGVEGGDGMERKTLEDWAMDLRSYFANAFSSANAFKDLWQRCHQHVLASLLIDGGTIWQEIVNLPVANALVPGISIETANSVIPSTGGSPADSLPLTRTTYNSGTFLSLPETGAFGRVVGPS